MQNDDRRAVVFTADTEDILLKSLKDIPGYTLSHVRKANWHPLLLTSSDGVEIYLQHTSGSTYAVTSSILPQEHEAEGRPFEQDEATKLSQAAGGMDALRATLELSDNDRAKLIE